MLVQEEITEQIIGAAITVHKALGPGLLESTYEVCLVHELLKCGMGVVRQAEVPLQYDGVHIECGYRIDVLVNDAIIVELKSVEKLMPIHTAQLITYMKLSGKRVGLLINFNVERLTSGIVRRVV